MARLGWALLAALTLTAAPLGAELSEARALRQAAEALANGGDRAALGQAIQANEAAMARLRDERRRLAIARGQALAQREAASARLDPSLRLLLAMRRAPLASLLDHPEGPQASAIAASLAANLAETAQSEIATLSALTADIDRLAGEAALLEDSLAEAQAALRDAADRLATNPARGQTGQAPDGIGAALLLANSEDLAELGDVLASLDLPDTPVGFCEPPLALPVAAPGLNAPSAQSDGLRVALRPGQIVTAPCAGVVRFAAPFPGHGEIVILESAPGLLFILGGFGTVFVEPGATVTTDTPLGSVAASIDGLQSASLYIEVRQDNEAEDIQRWFSTDRPGSEEATP